MGGKGAGAACEPAPWTPRTLININFPAIAPDAVRASRSSVRASTIIAAARIVKGTDPRGYDYYWFGLHGVEHTSGHDTDLEVIDDGYIAVTATVTPLAQHLELLDENSAFTAKNFACRRALIG